MKHILHTYKLRLTNISRGNRSLKLSKLSVRRDVDWMELGYSEGETPEAFLQKIIAGKSVRLIEKLDARFEKTNILDAQLNKIHREIQVLFEETGTKDLYVGYPFVEGKFADGTPVRCPVLLFPVELVRNLQGKPRWELQVSSEAEILPNPAFFLAYEQYQQTRLKPEFWEETPEYNADWRDFLNQWYAKIKEYEIEVNFNSDLFLPQLSAFLPYNKAAFDNFPTGKLTFKSQAVLGFFPQSDSALLQDYETMETMPESFDIARFFEVSKELPLAFDRIVGIPEEARFFVTPLDQTQEEVLLKIKKGRSLVVHGPPGTGKSQVIVNLIADAMMQGKKVLVVSQKRAALDVVYKRLSGVGLGRFAALVHDHQTDRNAIFLKIKQIIEDIPTFSQEIRNHQNLGQRTQFETICRQADNVNRHFEALYAALTHKQFYGLSVYDVYLKSEIEGEKFPLSSVAARLDVFALQQVIEKLQTIGDYIEFFAENHPWRHRNSFHLFRQEDKASILQKIDALPLQIAQLHEIYATISPELGKDVLDTDRNAERIAAFQQANAYIQDSTIHAGVAAIYKDELKPEFLVPMLRTLGELLGALSKCQLISTLSWAAMGELQTYLAIYNDKKNQSSRLLSIPYQKAVRFIKKILKDKQLEWTESYFSQLLEESEIAKKIMQYHVQLQGFVFFSDFPTEEIGRLGTNWVEKKQHYFDAWAFLEDSKHLRTHKPIFVSGVLGLAQWQENLRWMQKLAGFNELLLSMEAEGQMWLHPIQLLAMKSIIITGENQRIEKLRQTFYSDFEELKVLDSQLANFSTLEQEVLQVILSEWEAIANTPEPTSAIHTCIEKVTQSIYFHWIEITETQFPVLTEVSLRGFARQQAEFGDLLAQKQAFVSPLIQQELKMRICDFQAGSPMRELSHQTSKKRKLWPVRKLVRELWDDGLSLMLPCWMASPESVSAIFPMQKNYFDWVIFDEASQCFVERAIPSMMRGSQVIIAGDSKQLQPFDMYTVKYEEAEMVESEVALEVESVLDLAKSNLEEAQLMWHYRSQEEELMNFSNQAFYEGKLQIIPPAQHKSVFHPPLEWMQVKGIWENNTNIVEAEKVLELVLQWIQQPAAPSIGIVTFNYFQQELIKNLIDKKLEDLGQSNPELYLLFQSALQKTEKEEFVGLFVKNIENVQGDERDIIIFSVGYAHNTQGKLVSNFGLLNQQGGENRLNVAITRAKHKVYVVSSFLPSELNVAESKYEGPRLLKGYLQYVKAISEEKVAEASTILMANTRLPQAYIPNPIADFIAQKITEKGYFVVRNFGDTRYKLDIAVKKTPDSDTFLLAIECEGSYYFTGQSAKEREVFRRNLLVERGWAFLRISARNFWMNREKEVEKIWAVLEQ